MQTLCTEPALGPVVVDLLKRGAEDIQIALQKVVRKAKVNRADLVQELALFVALEGYRKGTRWAWTAMWVLVAAFTTLAASFIQAGETYALSFGILSFAVIALVGLLLARKGLSV